MGIHKTLSDTDSQQSNRFPYLAYISILGCERDASAVKSIAAPEDWSLGLSTHTGWLTTSCNSSSRGI